MNQSGQAPPISYSDLSRAMITDKRKSDAAATDELELKYEHRQKKGLDICVENSHHPTRVREEVMRRFKSARHLQRFVSVHG